MHQAVRVFRTGDSPLAALCTQPGLQTVALCGRWHTAQLACDLLSRTAAITSTFVVWWQMNRLHEYLIERPARVAAMDRGGHVPYRWDTLPTGVITDHGDPRVRNRDE